MSELKYLDKMGTFTLDNPDLTSYMYFPLANDCLLYTSANSAAVVEGGVK